MVLKLGSRRKPNISPVDACWGYPNQETASNLCVFLRSLATDSFTIVGTHYIVSEPAVGNLSDKETVIWQFIA